MNFEDESNPFEQEKVGIENAASFDELYEMLEILGDIQGTRKTYTPEMMRKRIEQVRHGHRDITFITRSHGLRDNVERLLKDDSVYKKYCGKKD